MPGEINMNKKESSRFENIVKEVFKPLTKEFDLRILKPKYCALTLSIKMKNNFAGITIMIEYRDSALFLMFHKLENNKIPDMPVFVYQNSNLKTIHIEDVLTAKGVSEDEINLLTNRKIGLNELEKTLVNYASAVKKYATDILAGNFTDFDKAALIVKERARKFSK